MNVLLSLIDQIESWSEDQREREKARVLLMSKGLSGKALRTYFFVEMLLLSAAFINDQENNEN